MAAESPQTTPPPVAETFVRVLVGFGGDCAAIPRLSAMVGVVEVMISREKWREMSVELERRGNSAISMARLLALDHHRPFGA